MIHFAATGGLLLAQENGTTGGSNPLGFLLPLIVLGGVFYALFILPQRRRAKKMNELRESIAVGDEVRTIGGIYGTVREEIGETFILDIGAGTTIRVTKRAVAEKVGADEE